MLGGSDSETILHCHLHLIPRRLSDVPEPVEGVRNVFPEWVRKKANMAPNHA